MYKEKIISNLILNDDSKLKGIPIEIRISNEDNIIIEISKQSTLRLDRKSAVMLLQDITNAIREIDCKSVNQIPEKESI